MMMPGMKIESMSTTTYSKKVFCSIAKPVIMIFIFFFFFLLLFGSFLDCIIFLFPLAFPSINHNNNSDTALKLFSWVGEMGGSAAVLYYGARRR
jgi:hypothetical protein